MSMKLDAGHMFPSIPVSLVSGGQANAAEMSGWRMLVVYRGKHCPLCKKYFQTLDSMADEFKALGVSMLAVSADTKEKAEADVAEQRWRFPVGYGLSLNQMRALGLYVSEPRSPQETDRPFAEPGLFVVDPGGKAHIIEISNAPFARPDLTGILNGIKIIQ